MATTNLGDVMFATIQAQADCTPITFGIAVGVITGELYVEKGWVYEDLDYMPFDYWDSDTWSFVHATGRSYWDGSRWMDEYEEEDWA